MDKKTPWLFVLIGTIIGFALSMLTVISYFLFSEGTFGQFAMFGNMYDSLMRLNLTLGIVGILLCCVLTYYIFKLIGNPTKTDYIVVTVIGGLGFIFGMGMGGLVVLIGGILGITKK